MDNTPKKKVLITREKIVEVPIVTPTLTPAPVNTNFKISTKDILYIFIIGTIVLLLSNK
jgi:hypothetical protein